MDISTGATVAVAVLTAVLAVATFWLAWSTRGMAKATQHMAQGTSTLANQTAVLAEETRRMAAAAEQQVEVLQAELRIAEATAQAAESHRAQQMKARVVPRRWSGRSGLEVRNEGAGLATEVRVIRRAGQDSYWEADLVSLGPGVVEHLREGWNPYYPQWQDGIPPLAQGRMAVRAIWRNADGTDDDAGWSEVPSD